MRKNFRKFGAIMLAGVMTAGMLAGCGSGSGSSSASASSGGAASSASKSASSSSGSANASKDAASSGKSSGSLSVYTAFPEAEVEYYFQKFEEQTGIKCNYVRLSAGEMLTRVAAEKDNPQAALMLGGSTDNYINMEDQGLIEPYQSKALSDTPENLLDPKGGWDPIYVGCIAFACNKEWFEDKGYDYPKSWNDLLDEKYKNEIIMAHPSTSGTAYTVLATLVQLMGEDQAFDYMKKLSGNITQFTKSGSAAPNAVAQGEAAIAITFSHDGLQPTAEGYPIELSFPDDGTGYEVGACALIKNGPADEQENAKKFIDWMTSTDGQNLYAENGSFRVPTNSKATVADGLVTLDQVKCIDYDATWAADNKSTLTARFESDVIAAPEEDAK
jgi:iron(III) transport system substrate-binding protein